jgi:hypothetical protein
MIPNAAEVARRRWTVTTCLRMAAFGPLILSTLPLGSWLTEGVSDGDLFDLTWYAGRIALGIVLVLMAAGFFLLAGRLARLLVPIRRHVECPACRHRIDGVTEPRCTECGLRLTPEFLTGQAPLPEPRMARMRRVVARRETVAAVFRVCGVLAAPIALLYLVALPWYLYQAFQGDRADALSTLGTFAAMSASAGVWTGAVLAFVFKARRLAAFCVPLDGPDSARDDVKAPPPPPQ